MVSSELDANISFKLDTLRKLRVLADEHRRQHSNEGTTVSFQPAWLWDLLDPKIYSSLAGLPHPDSGPVSGPKPHSKMYLKSHFVMPLHEDQDSTQNKEQPESSTNTVDSLFTIPSELELFNIEWLSPDFLQNRPWDQSLLPQYMNA